MYMSCSAVHVVRKVGLSVARWRQIERPSTGKTVNTFLSCLRVASDSWYTGRSFETERERRSDLLAVEPADDEPAPVPAVVAVESEPNDEMEEVGVEDAEDTGEPDAALEVPSNELRFRCTSLSAAVLPYE